jgi:DNA repair exonuclease SbcCD ATPase subunit
MKNVIFESVKLTNFKCHEEIDFNFIPNRFVMVTGPNGSGKSTLIADSITWACYDQTAKGKKGDSILRKRNPKDCSVIFKFSIDEDRYEIRNYRKHKEFGDEKFLFLNGRDITEASRKQTNDKIVNILMPPDIFLNCLLFSQYIGKSITALPQSGQRDILDKMLNFERYNLYYDLFKEENKRVSNSLKEIEFKLSQYENNLTNVLEMETTEKERKVNLESRYEEKIKEIEEEISRLKIYQEKLIPSTLGYEESEAEKTRIISELGSLEKQIEQLEEKRKKELDELSKNIRDEKAAKLSELEISTGKEKHEIELQINSKKSYISTFKEKVNKENSNLKNEYLSKRDQTNLKYKKIIDSVDSELLEIKLKITKVVNNISSSTKVISTLFQDISFIKKKLDSETPICYFCGQEIKEKSLEVVKSNLKEKETEYREEKNNLEVLDSNRSQLTIEENTILERKDGILQEQEEELSEIEIWKDEKVNELADRYKDGLSVIEGELFALDVKRTEILSTINKTTKEIEETYNSVFDEKKIKIYSNYSKIEKELQDKIVLQESLLEKVEYKIKEFKTIKEELERCKTWVLAKEKELLTTKLSYKNDKKEVDDSIIKLTGIVDKNKEDIEKSKAEKVELEARTNIVSFWSKAFSDSGIRAVLLDESIPILNEKAKELSLMTDNIRVKFDSQKSLKSGDMRNRFYIQPIQTKNLTDDRDDFSAGEGRLVDLICLMSLRYLLEKMHGARFNVLLLDEILDALDPDNVTVVLNMIRKMAEDHCIVLISHTLRDFIECDENLSL